MAECFQQGVTRLVPEAVVDALEAVQVQVKDGTRRAISYARLALFFETSAVQDAGQRVAERIGKHLSFVALALCYIDERHREILANRLPYYAQPAFTVCRLGSCLQADRRLRLTRIGKMSKQSLGFELPEFLQWHSDQCAGIAGKIRFGSPVRENAAEAILGIIAVPGEPQDAVGRGLYQGPDEVLAVRQPAQRPAAFRNVTADDNQSLFAIVRVHQRRHAEFIDLVCLHRQCLRQIEIFGLLQYRTCFREVFPERLTKQFALRLAQHFARLPVGADDMTAVIEHDNRVANMIEQHLVGDRTEFVHSQGKGDICDQGQHDQDASRRVWKVGRTETEEVVRETERERQQCANHHQYHCPTLRRCNIRQPAHQRDRCETKKTVGIRRVHAREPKAVCRPAVYQSRVCLGNGPDQAMPCIGQCQDSGGQRNDQQQRQDERIRRTARELPVHDVEGDRKKGGGREIQNSPDVEQRDIGRTIGKRRAGNHDAHEEHQKADDALR